MDRDLEGIQTCDDQIAWPVHVAVEVTDLEPISVDDYIEAQAADPWGQVMATKGPVEQALASKTQPRGP